MTDAHDQQEHAAIRALQDLLAGHIPSEEDTEHLTGEVKECISILAETLRTDGIQGVHTVFRSFARTFPWVETLSQATPLAPTLSRSPDRNLWMLYQALIMAESSSEPPLPLKDYKPLGQWRSIAAELYDAWVRSGVSGVKTYVKSFNNLKEKDDLETRFLRLLCSEEPLDPESAGSDETGQRDPSRGLGKKRRGPQITPKEVDPQEVLTFLNENEYGDARFFAAVFAGQVCFDSTSGKDWYLWAGHSWQLDTTGQIRQLVSGELATLYLHAAADLNTTHAAVDLKLRTLLGEGTREDDAQITKLKDDYKTIGTQMQALRDRAWNLRSSKRCKNVMEYIAVEMGITSDQWDTNQWALATPNGVIDLHTGTCRNGQPTDYIRTVCPTAWTGLHTPCPRFERYLEEMFEDKPDWDVLISFLQRLLGYGITGSTADHIFPIFYGEEGRNGKDTFFKTLSAVLGPICGAVSNDVFVASDRLRSGGAATPHLCDLQGKRLVWGSETKQGDKLNVAQIKLLTGGGAISTRQLHGKQYTFLPTHKLLLMTNYKPHADARDKAFWSRACLIEFSIRFVDTPQAVNERVADHHLEAALKQERSGILAWLVRGCLDWQREGLKIPSSILLATRKYQEEEDRLLLFIEERCLVAPHATVGADALYTAYSAWCKHNRISGMTGTLFGREMKKRYEKKHTNSGTFYQGIGMLVTEGTPTDQALPYTGEQTDEE
jgi:putative DNA primase/helicase